MNSEEYQDDHQGETVVQPTYGELMQFLDYVWETQTNHSSAWQDYYEDWKECHM